MKKFQYSMENILEIKLKLEDQAKIAYAMARMQLTAEEQKLAEFEQRKAIYEDNLRKLRMARLDLVELRHCEDAMDIMAAKIKQQTMLVKSARQRLETARIRFLNAMVERKTQDKLKEKAWEAYMQEYEEEEQKEINELNSFRHSNPMPGEEEV